MNPREVLGLRLWLASHEMITSGSPTEQFEVCGSGAYFRGIWIPECGGHVTDRHITGKRHLRTLAAAAITAPAEIPAVRWSCPSCGIHIDAPLSLLMHVAGERHRRAIDVLRHGGRIDDLARLVPHLRAAMAAVHRAGADDAQFGRLLRQARIDADKDVSSDNDTSDNDSGDHADKNTNVAEEDGTRAAAVFAPAVASGADSSAPDVGRRPGRKRRRDDGGGSATARLGPGGTDAAVARGDEEVARLEGGSGLRQDGGASRDGSVATSRNGSAVSPGMSSSPARKMAVVPAGAVLYMACPRCECLYKTAGDFEDHACLPPSRKGKSPAGR